MEKPNHKAIHEAGKAGNLVLSECVKSFSGQGMQSNQSKSKIQAIVNAVSQEGRGKDQSLIMEEASNAVMMEAVDRARRTEGVCDTQLSITIDTDEGERTVPINVSDMVFSCKRFMEKGCIGDNRVIKLLRDKVSKAQNGQQKQYSDDEKAYFFMAGTISMMWADHIQQ